MTYSLIQFRKLSIGCGIFLLFGSGLFAESFATLDRQIVEAYNSVPKKTQNMYRYAMRMLDRARLSHSDDADDWKDKAEKVISVTCFIEVDRALNNSDNTEAYLWAMRGIANGARNGELGGVRMKKLYSYFKDLTARLQNEPGIKDMKYGKTQLSIYDYNKVKKDNKYFSRDKTDLTGERVEDDKPYEILEGPKMDPSGHLYVKIRANFGTILKIMYYKGRGWQVVIPPAIDERYYGSWQECAAENSKIGNLNAVPVSPIRNKTVDKKTYFKPSARSSSIMSESSQPKSGGGQTGHSNQE